MFIELLKSFNSDWRKHSFSVGAPKLWNEIADSVRFSKTVLRENMMRFMARNIPKCFWPA